VSLSRIGLQPPADLFLKLRTIANRNSRDRDARKRQPKSAAMLKRERLLQFRRSVQLNYPSTSRPIRCGMAPILWTG